MSNITKQFNELQRHLHEAYEKDASLTNELKRTQTEINVLQEAIHEVVEKVQIEQALFETLKEELQEAEGKLKVAEHDYYAAKAHVSGLKGQLEAVLFKRGFEDRGDFMIGAVGTPSVSFGPRYSSIDDSGIGNKVYDGHTKATISPVEKTVSLHGFTLSGSDSGNYTLSGVVAGDVVTLDVGVISDDTLHINNTRDAFFAELIKAAK